MDIKGICGSVLAVIVGLARIAGGIISISGSNSATETWVGVGLIAVGLFMIISITMLWLKRSYFWLKMVSLSAIVFWIDGIINGFLLYGSPQLSGQIINICCAAAIFFLSRSIARNVSE